MQYFIYLIIIIYVFDILGLFIRSFFVSETEQAFYTHFQNLFVGMLAITTIYACIFTMGKTLLIGLLLIATIYLIYQKNTISYSFSKYLLKYYDYKFILISSLGAFLLFAWEGSFYLKLHGFPYAMPFPDTLFYSKISAFLSITGEENLFCYEHWISGNQNTSISLYHFFELWLNNLITNTFGLLNMSTYILVTQLVLAYACFIGILSWIEYHRKIQFYHLIIVFFLLFVESVFFEIYNQHDKLQYLQYIRVSLLGHISKKTAIYFFCFMAFMLQYQRQKYVEGFFILLCVPILSITALPAVFGGLGVWSLFLISRQKSNYKLLISLLFTAIFIGLFNILFAQKDAAISPSRTLSTIFLYSASDIRPKINLFIGIWLQIGILYLPFGVVLLFQGKKLLTQLRKDILLIFIFFSISITGLISWILFFHMKDMIQAFMMPTLPFLSIIVIYYLIQQFENQNYKFKYYHIILILVIGYNMYFLVEKQRFYYNKGSEKSFQQGYIYSDDYLLKVRDFVFKHNLNRGASYIDSVTYEKALFKLSPHMMRLGDYLLMMKNGIYTVSMHDVEIYDWKWMKRHQHIESLPFYQFAKSQPKNLKQEELEVRFVHEKKMDFLIFSKHKKISLLLHPYILEKIEDSSSGEKFIILKKNIP